jgi:tripartite-type tricarboxylate transporter receptor subunit TctC
MKITSSAIAALASVASSLYVGAAFAQTFPSKPIKMIVPIAAGSVTDVAARFLAQELTTSLGQPVVVVNRPGANMVIGAQECARSDPDGHTICVTSADAMSYNPFTLDQMSYDPDKDFRPVTNMYFVIEGLIASRNNAAKTVAEMRDLAVKSKGALNFGTLGPGSTTDTFRKWLSETWGAEFAAVPYKGGSEIINATIGNQIDVSRIGLGNVAGYLNDPQVKILAVRSTKRLPDLPDVPTMDEAGIGAYPGRPWWGVVVPAKTSDEVLTRLNKEINAVLDSAKAREFMGKQFLELANGTPAAFQDFLKQDRASAGQLIKKFGMK